MKLIIKEILEANRMIKNYIFKTIISFISLNAAILMTKENWLKLNPKHHNILVRNFNRLFPCLIPIFRWIFVGLVIVIGIALGNDDFVKSYKERDEK